MGEWHIQSVSSLEVLAKQGTRQHVRRLHDCALLPLTFALYSFSLTTRIDRPHDSRITSIAFSPSTSPSAPPLLLTTSTDGRCKLWALDMSTSTWSCRTSLSYRGFTPRDSAWAHDGSMFAVAHDHNVTLWSLADLRLIHAFPCAGIAPTRSVEFVNEEGTALLAGGQRGTVVWDLLTFEGE